MQPLNKFYLMAVDAKKRLISVNIQDRDSLNMEKEVHEVDIAGVQLKLRTSNHPEKVAKLVELVNGEVQRALDMSQSRSLQNAAIVAALNIAEQLVSKQQSFKTELSRLKQEAEALVADLESSPGTQIDH